MNIYQAIILGLVQGATEFLPVSSSAHLAIFPWLLGWEQQPLSFDTSVHLGTTIALVLYFAKEIINISKESFEFLKTKTAEKDFPFNISLENLPFGLKILIAVIPTGAAGILFKDQITEASDKIWLIAIMLIIGSIIMWLADRKSSQANYIDAERHPEGSHAERGNQYSSFQRSALERKDHDAPASTQTKRATLNATYKKMPLLDTLITGSSQALAFIRGMSRSGITMSVALFQGLGKEEAAKFTFLLGLPLLLAAGLLGCLELLLGGVSKEELIPFAVGIATSFLSGLAAMKVLIEVLKKSGLKIFVTYRILLATSLIVALIAKNLL